MKATINNRTHEIPDMWLVGACQLREREGMGYLDAVVDAIRFWDEQHELMKQFEVEP